MREEHKTNESSDHVTVHVKPHFTTQSQLKEKTKIQELLLNQKKDNNTKQSENEKSSIHTEENNEINEINKNIIEINQEAVELITKEKFDQALVLLKQAEKELESFALEYDTRINKKLIILVFHNIACVYQKLKDFDNCIIYLDAVIFHYDSLIENKYKIIIDENYLNNLNDDKFANSPNLGEIILKLRFSAKFHMQMCAVLSQAKNHEDAIKHAQIASYICEDNLYKTYLLCNQIKLDLDSERSMSGVAGNSSAQGHKCGHSNNSNPSNSNAQSSSIKSDKQNAGLNKSKKQFFEKEVFHAFKEKNQEADKILSGILKLINQFKSEITNKEKIRVSTSTRTLSDDDIKSFSENQDFKISNRNILGVRKNDDWISILNIGNIMFLSPIGFEDLELENIPKYELLRDAILEKILMLTIAYFCITTELRFIYSDEVKVLKEFSAEFWHSKLIEISCTYLLDSCPIVKHFISSYNKHFKIDEAGLKKSKSNTANTSTVFKKSVLSSAREEPKEIEEQKTEENLTSILDSENSRKNSNCAKGKVVLSRNSFNSKPNNITMNFKINLSVKTTNTSEREKNKITLKKTLNVPMFQKIQKNVKVAKTKTTSPSPNQNPNHSKKVSSTKGGDFGDLLNSNIIQRKPVADVISSDLNKKSADRIKQIAKIYSFTPSPNCFQKINCLENRITQQPQQTSLQKNQPTSNFRPSTSISEKTACDGRNTNTSPGNTPSFNFSFSRKTNINMSNSSQKKVYDQSHTSPNPFASSSNFETNKDKNTRIQEKFKLLNQVHFADPSKFKLTSIKKYLTSKTPIPGEEIKPLKVKLSGMKPSKLGTSHKLNK